MQKKQVHIFPRSAVYAAGLALGLVAGWINTWLDIDFSLRPGLLVSLVLAVLVTVVLHELVHAAVARGLGHRPMFGFKLPLVYVTFSHRIPRGHFMLIALAPFVLLNVVFLALYLGGMFRLFFDISLIVNTLGAMGDIWVVIMLLRVEGGAYIQDTKTGFEVWK